MDSKVLKSEDSGKGIAINVANDPGDAAIAEHRDRHLT